jgi:hypothetical protein
MLWKRNVFQRTSDGELHANRRARSVTRRAGRKQLDSVLGNILSSFCFHGTLLIFCELSPKRRGRLGKMHFYVIYPLTRGVNKGEKTMAGLTLKHIYKVYPGKVNKLKKKKEGEAEQRSGTSLQSRISTWKSRTGNLSSSSDLRVAVSLRRFV